VLLSLKNTEHREFVLSSGGAIGKPIALTPREQQLVDEMNELAGELGRIYGELDAHQRKVEVLGADALAQGHEKRNALQQQLVAKLDEVSARLRTATPDAAAAPNAR